MDDLVRGLGPAFAAGFALQRLLEIVDPLFAGLSAQRKKLTLGVVALVVGLSLAWWGAIRVLDGLGAETEEWIDVVVTALVVSGGTEGFNSIMKFLGYKKEEKKQEAKEVTKTEGDPPAG